MFPVCGVNARSEPSSRPTTTALPSGENAKARQPAGAVATWTTCLWSEAARFHRRRPSSPHDPRIPSRDLWKVINWIEIRENQISQFQPGERYVRDVARVAGGKNGNVERQRVHLKYPAGVRSHEDRHRVEQGEGSD